MHVYLALPGLAGATQRRGYRHWLQVHDLQFERPLLEKERAAFTIHKQPDALSGVLAERQLSGEPFVRVRVHSVEGSEAMQRLRFDSVRVHTFTIDGAADEALECVGFVAERWQAE